MPDPETTVTQKGQVTIPVDMRRRLGIKPGDRVRFHVEKGEVKLSRASVVAETAGKVTPVERPENWQRVHEDFEEGVADDVMRKR